MSFAVEQVRSLRYLGAPIVLTQISQVLGAPGFLPSFGRQLGTSGHRRTRARQPPQHASWRHELAAWYGAPSCRCLHSTAL